MPIQITPQIEIDDSDIQEDFIRASGPGGQKINKTASAVQLRFDVAHSSSLPEQVRQRLIQIANTRINSQGILIIESNQHRSQERNRQAARKRLIQLIRQAAKRPKTRKKTKPSSASIKKRLENKRKRSETKRLRRKLSPPE